MMIGTCTIAEEDNPHILIESSLNGRLTQSDF